MKVVPFFTKMAPFLWKYSTSDSKDQQLFIHILKYHSRCNSVLPPVFAIKFVNLLRYHPDITLCAAGGVSGAARILGGRKVGNCHRPRDEKLTSHYLKVGLTATRHNANSRHSSAPAASLARRFNKLPSLARVQITIYYSGL